MESIVAPGARWPDHLMELLRRCAPQGADGAAHPRLGGALPHRSAAWVALRDALAAFLRKHSRSPGGLSAEDIEDLASTKALELFSRCESGEWRVDGRSGGELAAYLSTVARNAVIDLVRRRGRIVPEVHPNGGPEAASALDAAEVAGAVATATPAADSGVMAREFVGSLRGCLENVQPRARRVWFLRVFYGMTSREIAQHPTVALRVGNVDVMMQRTRDAIRGCMQAKGFVPDDMPAGTFVDLWEAIESLHSEYPVQTAHQGTR